MKTQKLIIFFLLFIVSCKNEKESILNSNISSPKIVNIVESKWSSYDSFQMKSLKSSFDSFDYYKLTDTLSVDLNGDKVNETILFIKTNDSSGIKIIDGISKTITRIGLGVEFEDFGNRLDWLDYWGITYDKSTFEIVIKNEEVVGDRFVKLSNPAILLGKYEVGGGLIVYKNKKYVWIHQTC